MFSKILKLIKNFLLISVSEEDKKEFITGINKMNINRAKITAITFITLEVIQFFVLFILRRDSLFKRPDIYYCAMYAVMLIAMVIFLLLIIKFEKNITLYEKGIKIFAVSFVSFILLWCAGISLLDQFSSGQIIVYAIAVISISIAPLFMPVTLLIVFFINHSIFLILLPYFQKSYGVLFLNESNSTTFLIIAWVISYMRYNKHVEDFHNKKVLDSTNRELSRVNKELEKLSQTDSLTGIFNRYAFDKAIKNEWDRCRRHNIPLTLIMIDIDFFKAFNDNYGHQAGDDCLRLVAGVLSNCAKRSSDIVARYGGEEFAVILPHTKVENAIVFAEQIKSGIKEMAVPHAFSAVSAYLTISMGVHTITPSDKSSVEEFIKITDNALYEAKKERDKIVVI